MNEQSQQILEVRDVENAAKRLFGFARSLREQFRTENLSGGCGKQVMSPFKFKNGMRGHAEEETNPQGKDSVKEARSIENHFQIKGALKIGSQRQQFSMQQNSELSLVPDFLDEKLFDYYMNSTSNFEGSWIQQARVVDLNDQFEQQIRSRIDPKGYIVFRYLQYDLKLRKISNPENENSDYAMVILEPNEGRSVLPKERQIQKKFTNFLLRFLNSIKHEINTPLYTTHNISEYLLQKEKLEEGDREQHIKTIYQASLVMKNFVNDLNTYAHYILGTLQITPQQFSIKTLVDNCLSIFQYQQELNEIVFNVKYDQTVPILIKSDPEKISQSNNNTPAHTNNTASYLLSLCELSRLSCL